MLTYHHFDAALTEEWLEFLNSDLVRRHLIPHPLFTPESLRAWLQPKTEANQVPGCRVRAIQSGGELAGWCAIQFELPATRPQSRAITKLFGNPLGVSTIHGHVFNTYPIEIH